MSLDGHTWPIDQGSGAGRKHCIGYSLFFFFLVLLKEMLPQQETVLKFNLVRRLESVSLLNDGPGPESQGKKINCFCESFC